MKKELQKVEQIHFGFRKKQNISLEEIQYYLAHGVKLHPLLYSVYIDKICEMDRQDKLCLLPLSILQIFNRKFKK